MKTKLIFDDNAEKIERWRKMTTDQKRQVIKFQAAINLNAMAYVGPNAKCGVCSGPAYKVTGVAGNSVTVISCGACKFVLSLNNGFLA